ncbi:MAG: DUF692 domain-containing protein [Akkermansiaceae bacterium]|nr:DUF692 domain-containing protein [Akkermansiaceae bacterium]
MKRNPAHHDRPRGVGLAYRHLIHDEILANRDGIDLLEISTEDHIVRERRMLADPDQALLREAVGEFPSVAHGISLSLGTVERPDPGYLDRTRTLLRDTGIEIFSEHMAFHAMDGADLTIFLAMPFEEESVAWVAEKYGAVRAALERPFALENVTYYFPVPRPSMGEADFFRRLTEETDCSLLLDVTNLFNNSHNHGFDPIAWLDRYPLDRVSQIHLAGGHRLEDGRWEDSHSAPVMDPVWALFDEVLRRTRAEIVILERDSRFHPFERVREDLERAREIFRRHRPDMPARERPNFNGTPPGGRGEMLALDPEAPGFRRLRGFQRSLMARITSPEFREAFRADPSAAMAGMGLADPDWQRRVAECDRRFMHQLGESWHAIEEQNRAAFSEYERQEWAAWAELAGAAEG